MSDMTNPRWISQSDPSCVCMMGMFVYMFGPSFFFCISGETRPVFNIYTGPYPAALLLCDWQRDAEVDSVKRCTGEEQGIKGNTEKKGG